MKPLVATFACCCLVAAAFCQPSEFYPKRWGRVYRHELKSELKSALVEVDTLFMLAKKERNTAQLIKALLYQSKFALTLQEDAEIIVTRRIDDEIKNAKPPLKNILESVLAQVLWDYYNQNRYTYASRSTTDGKVNALDFRTWDTNAMLDEIATLFTNSLQNKKTLTQTDVHAIRDILMQAENSKLFRPSLYDLLAHRALDFFAAEEGSQDIEKERVDSTLFLNYTRRPKAVYDTLTMRGRTLAIYDDLLELHNHDRQPDALISLEIERILYLIESAPSNMGSKIHAWAEQSLSAIAISFAAYPSSALAKFEVASLIYSGVKNQRRRDSSSANREALSICDAVISAFPESDGALKCQVLKEAIESSELSIKVEKFVPTDKPALMRVEYKNIDTLFFNVYPVADDFNRTFEGKNDSSRIAALFQLNPKQSWSSPLPNPFDYSTHSTEIILPALPTGQYLIVACTKKNPTPKNLEVLAFAQIQCTNLTLIENDFDGTDRMQVLNRYTGRPIPNAIVRFFGGSPSSLNQIFQADEQGFINPKIVGNAYGVSAEVTHDSDRGIFDGFSFYEGRFARNIEDAISAKAFLFTDRSIYRPGQTLYFKGILIKTKNKKSSVVSGEYVEVTLENTNSDEVGYLRLKTNQYGSFSGEFKIPNTGLTGEYSLIVEEDSEEDSRFYDNLDTFEYSEIEVSVEDYKRPTFEVKILAPHGVFKVNDSISVKGTTASFSGAKITNSKVAYTVTRQTQYPRWVNWYNKNGTQEDAEIGSGETMTDGNGDFEIEFKAIPGDALEDNKPVFSYEISADVTDINGETRSAVSTVKVGYHSVVGNITAPARIYSRNPKNIINVSTENLNGMSVPMKGVVRVYKITSSDRVMRPRPWSAPDLPSLSEIEFTKLFPHDRYYNGEGKMRLGNRRAMPMSDLSFNTGKSNDLVLPVSPSWPLGDYELKLMSVDPAGDSVVAISEFRLIDPRSKLVPDHELFVWELDKPSYKPGETAHLRIGSAADSLTIYLSIEVQGKTISSRVVQLSNAIQEISIPIRGEMSSGFSIGFMGVHYNSFIAASENVQVIPETEKIEIETITFKDKIQPGAKETWSFEIKGNSTDRKEAEVLASMYDASLDNFKDHHWQFEPHPRIYAPYRYVPSSHQSFGLEDFSIRNRKIHFYIYPRRFFDELDWFGFSIVKSETRRRQYLDRLFASGAFSPEPSKVFQYNDRHGRNGFVSGIVRDENGLPIPGVNIVVKGTSIGTVTDSNGKYEIQVRKDDELVFSFIGYSTATAEVGRKNVTDVVLNQDVKQLSEVVVTALGTRVERKAMGSSVVSVLAADTTGREYVFQSLQGALNGRVAGVQITGASGAASNILIRGASTLNTDAQPLYVVDGVIVDFAKINELDLATIEVLKGTAATSLYGSRASAGVIIITTKSGQKKIDDEMAKVNLRKNFNETAFFLPHLRTDENGRVKFTFSTPESLTRWKLQLLAHTTDLLSTTKTLNAVTQKELMVAPNVPRFVRQGDEFTLTSKITNLSSKAKSGIVVLQLENPLTGQAADAAFGSFSRSRSFTVSPKGNTEVSWKLKIPENFDLVQYKLIAKAGNQSDGEQNIIPILSNRTLVTESMSMSIREGESKTFAMERLKNAVSTTQQNLQLIVDGTSNPAWFAIQSLPYLIEFPYECAEQTFSRFYANTLGAAIANSNPKIRGVFNQWAGESNLVSNLDKNPELKSILTEETPWVREARGETENQKHLGELFNESNLEVQSRAALDKLSSLQQGDGGITWFPNSWFANRYITQHIAAGFGHLYHLKIKMPQNADRISKMAVSFLDNEINKDYQELIHSAHLFAGKSANQREEDNLFREFLIGKHLTTLQIHYLYMRSFYRDIPVPVGSEAILQYFLDQSSRYWKDFDIQMKAMIALIHFRRGNHELANNILNEFRETSIESEEMGMYWKENAGGAYWSVAPVETQALIIEAFSEIERDNKSISEERKRETIDELRVWLLKNKQTSQWKTTKATTEAIYALLLNGTDWIQNDPKMEVYVVNRNIVDSPQTGTGYFKKIWAGSEVKSALADVKISKQGPGIAWAGMYWQYFEDLDKITDAGSTLKLTRKLFAVTSSDNGTVLKEIKNGDSIAIGTLVRVRIELTVDRYMEFLHLKDMRASGFEPIDVLSEYKYQEGLGYYQSTRDASTNFFFDQVGKGVYVFEYDLRAFNGGNFSTGITSIQCMYAPEFSSHSNGIRIKIN